MTEHLPKPPLGLYIHFPWCIKKCPYCDFNSHAVSGDIPQSLYIDTLIDDLRNEIKHFHGRKIHSIFMGGGTPSLFSAEQLARLIHAIDALSPLSQNIEITLEVNPGTAEFGNLKGYRQAGINRLSFGFQSFDNLQLKNLGRIHRNNESERAFQMARDADFKRINIDLMHGLPAQDSDGALSDLEKAISLNPEHLSWYQLTIEPNTVFYNLPPTLPTESTCDTIQRNGEALLARSGYLQYEVSAYCKPGEQSSHNFNYWQFGDFIGIGAGAHGKISMPDGSIERYWKTRKPADYLDPEKQYTAGNRKLTVEELPLEFLMNALRLNQGFDPLLFTNRTGLDWSSVASKTEAAISQQLLAVEGGRVRATTQGRNFLNNLLSIYI